MTILTTWPKEAARAHLRTIIDYKSFSRVICTFWIHKLNIWCLGELAFSM